MEKKVLTVEELAKRWDLGKTTIYSLNREGKLPHLPFAECKFPLRAIELIEEDPSFNPREMKTPRERRLEREIRSQEKTLEEKEDEIKRLKGVIARIQAFSTEVIYSEFKGDEKK